MGRLWGGGRAMSEGAFRAQTRRKSGDGKEAAMGTQDPQFELEGKTLGIVGGKGRIGSKAGPASLS